MRIYLKLYFLGPRKYDGSTVSITATVMQCMSKLAKQSNYSFLLQLNDVRNTYTDVWYLLSSYNVTMCMTACKGYIMIVNTVIPSLTY